LTYPYLLLALLPVAAVAAWALLRRRRQEMVVGSLHLWRRALESLDRSARKSSRRVTTSWLLLLAGAVAAVLAAAGPRAGVQAPRRRVVMRLIPSAGMTHGDNLRTAAGAVLDRLGPMDEVWLVRPELTGGATGWLSPKEARKAVEQVDRLPASAADLSVPPAPSDAQHVYTFRPAGLAGGPGPRETIIEIERGTLAQLAAAGAERLPEGGVEIFASARSGAGGGSAIVHKLRVGGDGQVVRDRHTRERLLADGTARVVARVEDAPAVGLEIVIPAGDPGLDAPARAWFVRRPGGSVKVSIVGRDEPLVRRFIAIDPALELVADASDADVVVANAADAPAGKPALVINPPTAPSGWRAGQPVGPVLLRDADIASDDPILEHVDLSGIAVRRVRPWIASGSPPQRRPASLGGDGLLLAEQPVDGPKRIFVAFDLAEENTNFGASEAFVIFLANAMEFLAPDSARRGVRYESISPIQAGPVEAWRRVDGEQAPQGPLPWPGLYRDADGALHAVNLLGVRAAEPNTPSHKAAAAAPLPEPMPAGAEILLWPWLSAAALLCWLMGWALRVTNGSDIH